MKSGTLSDVDLIAFIGRHGEGHARAIARRPGLNPTVAALAAAVEKSGRERTPFPNVIAAVVPFEPPSTPIRVVRDERPVPPEAEENTRRKLRAMMVPAGTRIDPLRGVSVFAKLRETALSGNLVFFQTALADALEAPIHTARQITADSSQGPLADALQSLGLSEEQAFVIAAAVQPARFSHAESIRLFLSRYRLLHPDVATERTRTLISESIAAGMTARSHRPLSAANESLRADQSGRPVRARR